MSKDTGNGPVPKENNSTETLPEVTTTKAVSQGSSLKSKLAVLAINLAFLLVGIEAVSLWFYYSQEGKFFYARGNAPAKIRKDLEKIGVRTGQKLDDQSVLERLHPFFAYVLEQGAFTHPESGLKVNNYGFFSVYDYPFVKTKDNQYVIGIFGGSVANDFAYNSVIDGLNGKGFIEYLKQKIPQLKDKEIIVLSFAGGGYKQPQQLLILNYFLAVGQEFDMVINIDGFNEVALSNLNNQGQIDVNMPSIQHVQPLAGLANSDMSVMRSMVNISDLKSQLLTGIKNLEECPLAVCYSWNFFQVQNIFKNYQQEVVKYDRQIGDKSKELGTKDTLVFFTKVPQVLDEDLAFNKMASTWYESSLNMHQILADKNIEYFHVIQPNQYYQTKRVFTQDEKNIAIIPNHPYSAGVVKGYPLLLSKAEDLKKQGVNVFSALEVLDEEPGLVYRDACCHYNEKGQAILFDAVAEAIAETINKQ